MVYNKTMSDYDIGYLIVGLYLIVVGIITLIPVWVDNFINKNSEE